MRLFGTDKIIGVVDRLGLKEDEAIDARILSNQIENAQKRLEDQNFNRRKNVLAYDDVMNQQRQIIYSQRAEVLDNGDLRAKIISMIEGTVGDAVENALHDPDPVNWDVSGLVSRYKGLLCSEDDFKELPDNAADAIVSVKDTLISRAMEIYEDKEKNVFGEEQMRELERISLLINVDRKWMDHLEAMDSVMETIGLQAYAQRNPISEYRIAAADFFDEMVLNIRDDTVRMILSATPKPTLKRVEVAKPVSAGFSGGDKSVKKKPVVNKTQQVGRNDPCPCGSGKKYKKCCGMGTSPSNEA